MTSPEILPCPFCGGPTHTLDVSRGNESQWRIECDGRGHVQDCYYQGGDAPTESEAITAHNRVAGAAGLLAEARATLGQLMDKCENYGTLHGHVAICVLLELGDLVEESHALLARIDALGDGK